VTMTIRSPRPVISPSSVRGSFPFAAGRLVTAALARA
jgi:hypothetical protein